MADSNCLVTPKHNRRQEFYPDEELRLVGYVPSTFLIVRIGDSLYELQGQVGPECDDPEGGFWWVNEVNE